MRSFVAQARRTLGDARVEAAIVAERVVLSLALRCLNPFLSDAEQRSRNVSSGLTASERPNAFLPDTTPPLLAVEGLIGKDLHPQ